MQRQKDVAFSYLTFVTGARRLTNKVTGIKELADLRRKRVVVTENTTTEKIVKQMSVERNLDLQIVTAKGHAVGFSRVVSGEVQAVGNDDALLFGLVTKATAPNGDDFVGKYVSVEPYAIMYRKDDPAFSKLVDVVIAGLFSSGQIRSIYAKWFESRAFKLAMNVYVKEAIALPNRHGVQSPVTRREVTEPLRGAVAAKIGGFPHQLATFAAPASLDPTASAKHPNHAHAHHFSVSSRRGCALRVSSRQTCPRPHGVRRDRR